jgi:hypothetical protein
VVVIAKKSKASEEALGMLGKDTMVIDLVRIADNIPAKGDHYNGICW